MSRALVSGLVTQLVLMSGCAYGPGSDLNPEVAGTLDIFFPLPVIRSDDGETTTTYIQPGSYLARVDDFSRDRLRIDIGPVIPYQISFELTNPESEFPTGGGAFVFTPQDMSQPVVIRGEYALFREESAASEGARYCSLPGPLAERCYTTTNADGTAQTQCYTYQTTISGYIPTLFSTVSTDRDYVVRIFDPYSSEELARFTETKPTQYRRSERALRGCIATSRFF